MSVLIIAELIAISIISAIRGLFLYWITLITPIPEVIYNYTGVEGLLLLFCYSLTYFVIEFCKSFFYIVKIK